MPSGSLKENVAHKYCIMVDRLKAHVMRSSIFRVLGLNPDVANDTTLAMFLVTAIPPLPLCI